MSFQEQTRHHFNFLADALFSECQSGEDLNFNLSAEDQNYVRFNDSKVRQATSVWQRNLTLTLQCAGRKVSCTIDLTGNQDSDLITLRSLLKHARQEIQALPEDPYIVAMKNHGQSVNSHSGQLPELGELISSIAQSSQGTGFTGLFAAGPQIRAVRNSAGLDHWFSTESFFLDYSLFTTNTAGEHKAIKSRYAGQLWQQNNFLESLQHNRQQLGLSHIERLSPIGKLIYICHSGTEEP